MKIIRLSNSELTESAYQTSLKSSAVSGASTLSAYSIAGIAVNNIVVIGEFGQEGTEIIKTHASSAPSGTTVTLASNLVKSHPKDTVVYVIPYDQAQFYHAATETGSKTLMATSDIDEESEETKYEDGTYTSGFYFVRFLNSINGNYTDYSDAIPYGGFASNTVAYLIKMVMQEMNKEFTEKLTYEMLTNEINACLRYIRGKLKKWSNVETFDYVIGAMDRGEYKFALPTDYYDKNSNRSCLSVRVSERDMKYIDKKELDGLMDKAVHTTIATQATTGDTTLALTSAEDFDSNGTVHVYSGTTQYAITYTGKSGNTLTGIPASGTGSITATLAADLNVWQGESEGNPYWFTIFDGYLYLWSLISSTDSGNNVYMDYFTDIVEVDSDADEIAWHGMICSNTGSNGRFATFPKRTRSRISQTVTGRCSIVCLRTLFVERRPGRNSRAR
jgi:hypothetical protein